MVSVGDDTASLDAVHANVVINVMRSLHELTVGEGTKSVHFATRYRT